MLAALAWAPLVPFWQRGRLQGPFRTGCGRRLRAATIGRITRADKTAVAGRSRNYCHSPDSIRNHNCYNYYSCCSCRNFDIGCYRSLDRRIGRTHRKRAATERSKQRPRQMRL